MLTLRGARQHAHAISVTIGIMLGMFVPVAGMTDDWFPCALGGVGNHGISPGTDWSDQAPPGQNALAVKQRR